MAFTIGMDTGGTFVDIVVSDGHGELQLTKSPSDQRDLAGSVITGLSDAAREMGMDLRGLLADTTRIVHGSTVATNALLTGRGSRAALLTTEGFRDVLNMRRGVRERAMDSRHSPPRPLIPRERIMTVRERVDCEGRVLRPLDEQALQETLDALAAEEVTSVGVCLLYSFLNDEHERRVAERVAARLPNAHVSLSSEVLPQVRLYERLSTTAVNAAVSPLLASYLDDLGTELSDHGFHGTLVIMQSNGGVASPEIARKFGVGSVLSGPAAAPVAAARLAEDYGLRKAIGVDMGGTSFDVCLINGRSPDISADGQLAGYRIAVPMVALHTIGAGGGSIVSLDSRNLLSVGPDSAGAYPGPVCYGRGGTEPTVTDANLLLGYIDADSFWGGRLRLDVPAAERAFEDLGRQLGLGAHETAFGAYRIANESMVDAIREVSVRQGHDPREFVLVAAGGAGPLHVGALARELEIKLVIVPRLASVFCALGGMLSDLRHEFVKSLVTELGALHLPRANQLLDELREQGRAALASEGVGIAEMQLRSFVDARYVGQFTEVSVPLSGDRFDRASLADIQSAFHEHHELINGYRSASHALEIVNVRVVAVGRTEKVALRSSVDGEPHHAEPGAKREVYVDGAWERVPVHDAKALRPSAIVAGPAVIDHGSTTILVPADFEAHVDRWGNCLLQAKGRKLDETLDWLRAP